MVQSGRMTQVACDEIYGVYGVDNSVINILSRMQRDERIGGNLALISVLLEYFYTIVFIELFFSCLFGNN